MSQTNPILTNDFIVTSLFHIDEIPVQQLQYLNLFHALQIVRHVLPYTMGYDWLSNCRE